METLILIITIVLLAETTFLVAKSSPKFKGRSGHRKIYIDTSALIDGRIVDIARTGFLDGDLFIPRSVIRELQLLADGKDKSKREFARHGLDNANELERVINCNVSILQDELDHTPVDERLIALAKENHGLICTNDFNLNKVAATENIEVLNVNDLTIAVNNDYYPGKIVSVKVTSLGSNKGQGVGHLEDGTMVVIDHAAKNIGADLKVEIIRCMQTSAGRMIFARRTNRRKNPS